MWCSAECSCWNILVSSFLCENRHQHKELWHRGSIWAEYWRINRLERRGRQCFGIMSKLRADFSVYTILGALFQKNNTNLSTQKSGTKLLKNEKRKTTNHTLKNPTNTTKILKFKKIFFIFLNYLPAPLEYRMWQK